jgi:1-phosphofructokinase family hexose kinase
VITCVVPNPSIDKLFEVERLEPGRIHRPASFVQVPGGKGLNVARAASALGADVRVVALLGGHAGRWIADQLGELGISLSAVWREAETRSCLTVASGGGPLTEFYESGSPLAGAEWTEFVRAVAGQPPADGWTTVSGSLPPGAPEAGCEQLVTTPKTAVDSVQHGAATPALVKVNAAEARELTGLPVDEAAARALWLRIGGEGHAALVTHAEGAVVVTPDGSGLRGTLGASGPYPVGSGDAFLAGLVVALHGGAGWRDALCAALGSGAANADVPGAGRLDRDHAAALAERVRIVETAE